MGYFEDKVVKQIDERLQMLDKVTFRDPKEKERLIKKYKKLRKDALEPLRYLNP